MRRIHAPQAIRLAGAVALLFLVAACAAVPVVNRANTFAEAGVAFADAVPGVVDQSFEALVEADSVVLEQNRPGLASERSRLEAIEKSNEILARRLEILGDLKRHATLLRTYFVALRAMTQTGAASELTGATGDIVTKLEALSPKIKQASFAVPGVTGGQPIGELVAPAVKIAVAAFQNRALQAELTARAEAIERELALQEAALGVLTDATRFYMELIAQDRDFRLIIEPYVSDAPGLPRDWRAHRPGALRYIVQIPPAQIAAAAARDLREAFVALARGKLDGIKLSTLVQDVKDLAAQVKSLRAETP